MTVLWHVDRREYAPEYGLSGFPVEGSMMEAVHRFLGTIDEHHDDPLWDEIRIQGLSASQLDPALVQESLRTKVTLADAGGSVVVTRIA